VRAKSSTGKAAAKPLCRLELETAERVVDVAGRLVDVAGIDTGIVSSDLISSSPQRLGMSRHHALRIREIAERV
jgi:hypothetical protein